MDSLDSMFLPAPLPPPISPKFDMRYIWCGVFFLFLLVLLFFRRKEPAAKEMEPETPKELIKEKEPKEEIKEKPDDVRGAGIAVRDALLNFSVNAEQIASIVRYTVSILAPAPHSSARVLPSAPSSGPVIDPAPVKLPTPSKTHFSVKGLELPIEDEPEAEPGGEKQGKINADTNPLVLQMVKDRKS
jgi:hypothetical protein